MGNFGGIEGHEKQKDIDALIISMKVDKKGFRLIAKELESKFGVKVSHTLLGDYYKKSLSNPAIDKLIDNSLESGSLEGFEPVELDSEMLNSLKKKFKSKAELGEIYAYAVALCEANIKAHVRGEQRLKVEYVKYLKDVKSLFDS